MTHTTRALVNCHVVDKERDAERHSPTQPSEGHEENLPNGDDV
jgi:hypothetical protein